SLGGFDHSPANRTCGIPFLCQRSHRSRALRRVRDGRLSDLFDCARGISSLTNLQSFSPQLQEESSRLGKVEDGYKQQIAALKFQQAAFNEQNLAVEAGKVKSLPALLS